MSKPVKVYNKGTRPVVFKRDLTGTDAIHPGKFMLFSPDRAKSIISKFEHACSEADYEKQLEEVAKKQSEIKKEAAVKEKKKTETESKK